MRSARSTLFFLFGFSLTLQSQTPLLESSIDLTSVAERSGFIETGRYAEVQELCLKFEKAYANQVKCKQFGITPQGRPMLALIASQDGTFTPELVKKRARPVFLAQGGIHSGEIDGKDAGFLLLRDILDRKILVDALSKMTLVFVPVFNVDGHERFGPNNRPNQIGPREMGFRTTAQNYNLNRDYTKADAPEMRAMIQLFRDFDPVIYTDLHVTDGADFQHEVSVQIEPTLIGDLQLKVTGRTLLALVMEHLTETGHKPLDFYPSFLKKDDPTSGFSRSSAPPRFSTPYAASRNRFGVLVETHSWKDYKTRVRATYDTLVSLLDQTMKMGVVWKKQMDKADARSAELGATSFPLTYKNGAAIKLIDFLGYEYKKAPSEISGGEAITYNPQKPQIWKVPLLDTVEPDLTVTLPKAGYLVPVEFSQLVSARLDVHGIIYETLKTNYPNIPVSQFRATSVKWPEKSFEGRSPLSLTGEWESTQYQILKGSLFIPINQPLSRLVIAICEPLSPESFASWGDFNNQFERKEYMENYVAEVEAKKMLAKDENLKKEFDTKLSLDKDFANTKTSRLDFFYQRHPSFDARLNIYPIYRLDQFL